MNIKFQIKHSASLLVWGLIFFPQIGTSGSSRNSRSSLEDLTFRLPELWVTSQTETLESLGTEAPLTLVHQWEVFLEKEHVNMTLRFDRITGKTSLINGEGIPWIPGPYNGITGPDLGLPEGTEGKDVPVDIVAAMAIDFLKQYPSLFGIPPHALRLASNSGPYADQRYTVRFIWTYYCIPVEKALLSFDLSYGDMNQVGIQFIADSINKLDPHPYLTADDAWSVLAEYIGGFLAEDLVWDPGSLAIIPVSTPETLAGQTVPLGMGLDYRLTYSLSFVRPSIIGTWEALIDAHTGEILAFRDTNYSNPMIQGNSELSLGLSDQLTGSSSEESDCSCHRRPTSSPSSKINS